jgi:hypothetical protein
MTVCFEFFGSPALGPRQSRHDNCGSAGDDQPERAGTGTISPKDGRDGIHHYVGCQREESEGDDAKRPALPGSVRLRTGQNCAQLDQDDRGADDFDG